MVRIPSKAIGIGLMIVIGAACAGVSELELENDGMERTKQGLLACERAFVELSEIMFQMDMIEKSDLDKKPDNRFPNGWRGMFKKDPFSPNDDEFKLFSSKEGTLSRSSLIASVGPDGDSDLGRLPDQETVYPPMRIPPNASKVAVSNGLGGMDVRDSQSYKSSRPLEGIVYIEFEDGTRATNTPFVVRNLPSHDYFLEEDEILAHLARNSIFQYDPTNGAVSDGDVFVIYPDARRIQSGEENSVYGVYD